MTTSYTTSAGITVDLSTSGFVLSSYLQAFGLDPAQFRQESVWNEIPIAQAMQRKRPLSPTSSNLQDPTAIGAAVGQTSLFSCTITLPPLCPIRSVSSPGIGHKNKATAKKHAQLRCVIMLLERGDIGPDLKPNTLRIPRAKSPPSSSQNPRTAGRPQDVGQYDYKRAQHVHKQASSTMPGMRSTPTMLPLSSFGGQDKHRQERLASIHASLRDKLPINPISSKSVIPGMAEYDYLANAGFWSTLPTFQPDKLYPTLIHLKLGEPYQYVNDKCRIMCLITSRPLPDFENGQHTVDATMTEVGSERKTIPASVDVIQGKKMLEWPEGKLEQAIAYTTRLMRAQLNKGVRPDLANLKWLIVPVNREYNRPSKISGPINLKRRDIDWDEVERGNGPIWTPFTFEDPDALAKEAVDAMTSVKHEYCKRSFVKCIRTDLNPFSPLPSEPDKRIADTAPNYQEPIIAEQCIIEAEPVLTLRRGGVIASVIPPKVNGVPQESSLLMPQLVQRHCISASAYRTTSILPSVLLALDDLLIAKDLSDKVFDGALVYHQAQTALSCPVSHNGAPHKSYQRLEMLGDTLLKFLSGVFLLYRTQSDEIDWDELHEIKQLMVSNRALGLRVLEAGVMPYIRGPSQKYNNWLPMGWQMEEDPHKHQETAEDQAPADKEDEVEENQRMKKVKTSDDVSPKKALKATAEPFIPSKPIAKADFGEYSLDQMYKDGIHPYQSRVATPSLEVQSSPKQRLGDKTIADVCEALIAAAYFSFGAGIDGAIKAMHCLNLPIEGMTNWAEVVARSSELEGPKPSNVRVKPATLLDYQFRNPDYAHDVMNIGSEHKTNFLKFKILGDAVLDYFIIEELYHQYPQAGPGQLTVMRHSRHGDACLASFCVVSGLVNQVVNIPVAVITEINKFKQSIDSARRIADKAVDDSDRWEFWAEILPLHYFGEVMNALFGAILVDSHYDIKAVKKVYDTHFKPFLDRYCIGPTERSLHPRVVWSEMIFKRGCTHWELTKESQRSLEVPFTSRVIVHGRVLGYGEGDTQVIAMRKACENAVKKVKMGNPLDTVCSCPRKKGKSGTSAVKR